MKPTSDLILDLQHAEGPDRKLDLRIAMAIGYQRKITTDDKDNAKQRKVIWLTPGTKARAPVPLFTRNLDVAQRMARTLVPGCTGGFTWGGTFCTAAINDGPRFTAATPSLALCAAALSAALVNVENLPREEN